MSNSLIILMSAILIALLNEIKGAPTSIANTEPFLRPCYFTNWAQYRQDRAKFMPEDYIPGICTHMLFAFGWMNEDFTARAYDPADLPTDWAGAVFQAMASTPAGRKTFITSSIKFVRTYGFDGIDIDWEYPKGETDKQNFVDLIKELRAATVNEASTSGMSRLLVTAAVSAAVDAINSGYNIPALADDFDFILLMSYDFHGAWDSKTGLNAPLYPRQGDSNPLWNVAGAASYWAEQGMPKNKIVVGAATYGRGWTLANEGNNQIGAPGSAARTTKYVREAGTGAYFEFCEMLVNGATRHWDDEAKVPYLVQGDQWFSYDDVESLRYKAQFVKDEGYGGMFVWTLDFDDFNGRCSTGDGKKFPLISAIADVLAGDRVVVVPETTTTNKPQTTTPTSTTSTSTTSTTTTTKPSGGELEGFCEELPNGFHSLSPFSCSQFMLCLDKASHLMECPSDLQYSENFGYCVGAEDSGCKSSLPPTPPPYVETTTRKGQVTTKTPIGAFTCNQEGFFPDPISCFRFYRCVNTTPYLFDCPGGLAYNKKAQLCDRIELVEC
uniref:Chitin-binding type-2 domain-containing protein n=1 Tax=Rhabditophanes sp. KR3021 TaxID=114890 RepID=A0AC35TLC0_9BILA